MAMLLKDEENGSEFELGLIEDRLPEVQDGTGDAGYLTLSFRVATPEESWEETSPCINTYEVQNLAEWLDAVAGRGADEAELELLEPELTFAVVRDDGDSVTLRVGFHLDERPDEFAVDAPTDEAEYVDLTMTRGMVRAAAQELRRDIAELAKANLKDDLTGEDNLGEVRSPVAELGLSPFAVGGEEASEGVSRRVGESGDEGAVEGR